MTAGGSSKPVSHDKMRSEMEFEKEIAVERMRQETEKAKLDMEGQCLSMGTDGAVLGEWHGVQVPKSPQRTQGNFGIRGCRGSG
ncbi:hypothetical protein NQZ68_013266 [Dissostichus eleginoides]|nr:hypothetical protein NQZ68_013266 [Dissostichus eleginoides]